MGSLDVRSRTGADISDVDPDDLFRRVLPAALAANGHLAAPAAAAFRRSSFTFALPTGAHTITFDGEGFGVHHGDDGEACARLDAHHLAGLVDDLQTPMTFLTGGTLDTPRGNLDDFLDWWVVLRSVIDGREAYTAGSVALLDQAGGPLDLVRGFTPDDADDEIAHHLLEAGYLHLRGWLDPDDMAQISADMDAALPTYAPDDGRSWWARTSAGEHRCVRMQHFEPHSPTTTRVLNGDVLRRVAALTGDGHVDRGPGTPRVEALEKPIGVIEGISDVPWHKDCSLGMHSYNCCSLTVGISVTGADASSGQLRVVAGSHRALLPPAFVRPDLDLPLVDLPTEVGDITVHCSCTLHMAQPPVDRERRVLYTGFGLPPLGADDTLRERAKEIGRVREGSYKTVSQVPSRHRAG